MLSDLSKAHEVSRIILAVTKRMRVVLGPTQALPILFEHHPLRRGNDGMVLFIAADWGQEDRMILEAQTALHKFRRHNEAKRFAKELTKDELKRLRKLLTPGLLGRFVTAEFVLHEAMIHLDYVKDFYLFGAYASAYDLRLTDGAEGQVARVGRALYPVVSDIDQNWTRWTRDTPLHDFVKPVKHTVERLPELAGRFLALDDKLRSLKEASKGLVEVDTEHLELMEELRTRHEVYREELDQLAFDLDEVRKRDELHEAERVMNSRAASARRLLDALD